MSKLHYLIFYQEVKIVKDRQYQKWSSDEVEFLLSNLDKPLLFLSEKLSRRKELVNKKVKQLTGKHKTEMEKEEEYNKIVFDDNMKKFCLFMNCIKRNLAGRKVNINMMELRGFFEQFKKDMTLSNNIFGVVK